MRVFGYVRVSTDRQDLQRQKQQISDFCAVNNHEIIHIYSEKISGATEIGEREELSLLMQKTSEDADLVIISEMSRYSRQDDLVEVVYSISKLLKRGLSLIFLDNPSKIYEANSTLSIEEIIMLIAKAFANAEERKKIFYRMNNRKLQLIEKYPNVVIGSQVPYGFKTVPNPKYDSKKKNGEPKTFLEVDEYEKEVIIELFKRSAQGESYRELQKYFDENSKRPIRINKKRMAQYGDLPRQSLTIPAILNNRLYCGERVYSNQVYQIEAIVSKELFQKSQDAHKNNSIFIDRINKCFNPLKGLIKCYCGCSMSLGTIRGQKVYTCYKSRKGSEFRTYKWCGNYGINQELLIDIIANDIKHGLNEELREKYDKATSDKLHEIREQISKLQDKFSILSNNRKQWMLERDNLETIIIKTKNESIQNRFLNKLEKLESDINKSSKLLNELDEEIHSLKEFECNTLNQNRNIVVDDCNSDEYKDYLRTIINKVIYRGYDRFNGLVMIIYQNGFISYYAVRKSRSWPHHHKLDAEIYPISDEYIQFDEDNRVILKSDYEDKKEITNIEEVYELVKKGRPVTILQSKIRAFHQRYL